MHPVYKLRSSELIGSSRIGKIQGLVGEIQIQIIRVKNPSNLDKSKTLAALQMSDLTWSVFLDKHMSMACGLGQNNNC